MAYFSLRPELYFDQVADVRATNQAMPGKTVIFTIVNDLPINSTALSSESVDITPIAFSDSQVSVSLAEYGTSMVTSAKLRGTAFVDVDPVVANLIGYNAGVSMDSIARDILAAGQQVALGGTTTPANRNALSQATAGHQITSQNIRTARARLRAQNVPTFGGAYVSFIHPDVVVDLQNNDTSYAGWRAPHVYSAPSEIWTGDLGMYEGVRFIETPRAPEFLSAGLTLSGNTTTYSVAANVDTTGAIPDVIDGTFTGTAPVIPPKVGDYVATATTAVFKTNAGAVISDVTKLQVSSVIGNNFTLVYVAAPGITASCTTAGTLTFTSPQTATNVYGTIIVGRQSLAKAHAMADGNGPLPSIVPGPVTDLLRRFVPLGWYWLGGYSIFRQASVYRIETTSSLGDGNVAIDL